MSMDKTLAVWSFDEDSGLWVDIIRLGEVGGNTLGFYGGKFSPDGCCILAQGHHGSFHLWKKVYNLILIINFLLNIYLLFTS